MAQADETKLERFRQIILDKANAEKQEILKNMEKEKQARLDEEENRQLEELYRKIQLQIADIRTENVREISRETLSLKKEAYRRREQYLSELMADARAELQVFVGSPGYKDYLLKKAKRLAEEYPFPGSVLRVRREDLSYAGELIALFPGGRAEADERIAIGGLILSNPEKGIEVDESLSRALEEQRDWFYQNSQFKLE